MRWFRSSTGYDVTFTLINPQPDALDVQWDIQTAVKGGHWSCCQAHEVAVSVTDWHVNKAW
jgi:hypothetical protein